MSPPKKLKTEIRGQVLEMKLADKEFELLISKEKIEETVASLAKSIANDYADKRPLLLCVLNGSFIFSADLVRRMEIECEISFIKLSSYRHQTTSSGKVRELIGLHENIFNRHIIIIEDIVDTGLTLKHLFAEFKDLGAASFEVVTLLHKPEVEKRESKIKYVGIEIPDKFVVGYGLDYQGLGRNLPDLYCVRS